MRSLLLRSCLVLFLTVIASGIFFEWILLEVMPQQGNPNNTLARAFTLSLAFDLLLVLAGALALSWPLYRRLLRLSQVIKRQQEGELEARAEFSGSDPIAELANNFDRLATINAQQLENQRDLLRAVSHELRTPVARLRFTIASLAKAPAEERATLREEADTDIDELDLLIEEILTYSRASAGGAPRELERFDLCDILERLLLEHPKSKIQIQSPEPLLLCGEPRLIHRALSNLVRNAVHYARSLVTIKVQVQDDIKIYVVDDGPGLPSHASQELFQPFVHYGTSGTGLGTSIAFAVAQRHGGHLYFTARPPDTGAEFVMQLPLSLQTNHKES